MLRTQAERRPWVETTSTAPERGAGAERQLIDPSWRSGGVPVQTQRLSAGRAVATEEFFECDTHFAIETPARQHSHTSRPVEGDGVPRPANSGRI